MPAASAASSQPALKVLAGGAGGRESRVSAVGEPPPTSRGGPTVAAERGGVFHPNPAPPRRPRGRRTELIGGVSEEKAAARAPLWGSEKGCRGAQGRGQGLNGSATGQAAGPSGQWGVLGVHSRLFFFLLLGREGGISEKTRIGECERGGRSELALRRSQGPAAGPPGTPRGRCPGPPSRRPAAAGRSRRPGGGEGPHRLKSRMSLLRAGVDMLPSCPAVRLREKSPARPPHPPARRPNHCGSPPRRLHKQPRNDVSLRRLRIPPPSAGTTARGVGRSGRARESAPVGASQQDPAMVAP